MLEHICGGAVPYHGYFCVKVLVPVGKCEVLSTVPMLLVLDIAYNGMVPLLIGTNYLQLISHDFKILFWKILFNAVSESAFGEGKWGIWKCCDI